MRCQPYWRLAAYLQCVSLDVHPPIHPLYLLWRGGSTLHRFFASPSQALMFPVIFTVFSRLDQDVPQNAQPNAAAPSQHPTGGLCSRTYITFSDDEAFQVAFSRKGQPSPQLPVQEICPVTHKIALYRDPVTDIPYANARAFRIIREAYRKYVAAHGFPSASGAAAGLDSSAKGARQKMMAKQGSLST